jgi:DNA-binding NtrC family response regulator
MVDDPPRYSVLVVDDDVVFARAVARRLDSQGWETRIVTDGAEALRELAGRDFDAMVLDLNMQQVSGFGVLDALPGMKSPPATILLSGHLSVPTTVQAMRAGVADVLEKPADGQVLDEKLRAAVAARNRFPSSVPPADAAERLIGTTSAIRTVRDQIRHAARQRELSVMVVGEAGTGKGLIARIIHELTGVDSPFMPVDCAAIPAGLLERKLFGVDVGDDEDPISSAVGLFESAGSGTLFFDDVSTIPAELQPKLLQVLDSGRYTPVGSAEGRSFRARIISTTSRRVIDTQKTNLRADLYYRLAAFTISLPPLRDRKDDVGAVASHFLRSFARRNPEAPTSITEDGQAVLHGYDWPGNLRELRSVVEQAAMLTVSDQLGRDEIYVALNQRHAQRQLASDPPRVSALEAQGPSGRATKLRDFERTMIIGTYEACDHNLSLTARKLGLPRTTLRDKLKRYGVR